MMRIRQRSLSRQPHQAIARLAVAALVAPLTAALVGCAAVAVPSVTSGEAREAVLARWGSPTARYAMPAGGERLEYASGPFGRTTWMIDIDTGGRVQGARQVLNEAHFAELQGRAPAMNRGALLRELGTPGERRGVGRFGEELWSWRYPTNDCLWFQAVLDPKADKVVSTGYNIDPRCDPPTADRS